MASDGSMIHDEDLLTGESIVSGSTVSSKEASDCDCSDSDGEFNIIEMHQVVAADAQDELAMSMSISRIPANSAANDKILHELDALASNQDAQSSTDPPDNEENAEEPDDSGVSRLAAVEEAAVIEEQPAAEPPAEPLIEATASVYREEDATIAELMSKLSGTRQTFTIIFLVLCVVMLSIAAFAAYALTGRYTVSSDRAVDRIDWSNGVLKERLAYQESLIGNLSSVAVSLQRKLDAESQQSEALRASLAAKPQQSALVGSLDVFSLSLQMKTDENGITTHRLDATSISLNTWVQGAGELSPSRNLTKALGSMTGLVSYLKRLSAGGDGPAVICPPTPVKRKACAGKAGNCSLSPAASSDVGTHRLLPLRSARGRQTSHCGRRYLPQLMGSFQQDAIVKQNATIASLPAGATKEGSHKSTSKSGNVYAIVLRGASTPSRVPLLVVPVARAADATALVVLPSTSITPAVCNAAATNTSVQPMAFSNFLSAVMTSKCSPSAEPFRACSAERSKEVTFPEMSQALTIAVCSALRMRVRSFVSTYHPVPKPFPALQASAEDTTFPAVDTTFPSTVRSVALATASVYAIAMRALAKPSQVASVLNASSKLEVMSSSAFSPTRLSNVSKATLARRMATKKKDAASNVTTFRDGLRSVALASVTFYSTAMQALGAPSSAPKASFFRSDRRVVDTPAAHAESVALVPADFYAAASRTPAPAPKSASSDVSPTDNFYEVVLRALAKPSRSLHLAAAPFPSVGSSSFPTGNNPPLLVAPPQGAVASSTATAAWHSAVSDSAVLSMGAQAVLRAVFDSYASTIAEFAKSSLCPSWMEPTPTPSHADPSLVASTNSSSFRATKAVHSLLDTVLLARSRTPIGEQKAQSGAAL